jgi:hypothetical protein
MSAELQRKVFVGYSMKPREQLVAVPMKVAAVWSKSGTSHRDVCDSELQLGK